MTRRKEDEDEDEDEEKEEEEAHARRARAEAIVAIGEAVLRERVETVEVADQHRAWHDLYLKWRRGSGRKMLPASEVEERRKGGRWKRGRGMICV